MRRVVAAAATILAIAYAATDAGAARQHSVAPPAELVLSTPDNDDGRHIMLDWEESPDQGIVYLVFRERGAVEPTLTERGATITAPAGEGAVAFSATFAAGLVRVPPDIGEPASDAGLDRAWAVGDEVGVWTLVAVVDEGSEYTDETPESGTYSYAVAAARPGAAKGSFAAVSVAVVAGPLATATAVFNTQRWFFLLIVVLMAAGLWMFLGRAKAAPEKMYIRRIPGVDAIEEAVGRSTEMGRPVLYVTGVEEIQNIQTIASLLILGRVSEMTAEYDTDIKVANFFPLTMVVAEEIVKQGFANAGRIDAHKPENVMFISAEQFAFAAGVNGIILRDRPATNIYLGRFFAESLILAETGYVTRAIQIAGTAEITQLPFFIAACDYTIIGEELYAVSAYLSREPLLLATLKATDLVKLLIMIVLIVGAVAAAAGWVNLGEVLVP